MAEIGCLGSIPFVVSRKTVRTLNNMVWSGSARYGVHQRHDGDGLTEFGGLDPEQISFDIHFSAQLGVDPMEECWALWRLERKGTTLPLTIGTHAYGRYRWTITSINIKARYFDVHGELYYAVVTLKLQEYLKN